MEAEKRAKACWPSCWLLCWQLNWQWPSQHANDGCARARRGGIRERVRQNKWAAHAERIERRRRHRRLFCCCWIGWWVVKRTAGTLSL